MARTLIDEDIKLNIIINGNSAQKQLLDLEKSTRKVTEENKQLKLELSRVEKSLGKNSNEYKELSAKIKANTAVIDNNKLTMRELQKQIGITGLTMKQLGQQATVLRMQLVNAIPGSEAYRKYDLELQAINNRLSELKGKGAQASSSIGSLADKFNRYQALGFSVIATLTGVVLSVQKIIDFNSKLSESYADVMKTTGMTKDEVDELSKSFGLFETRTSRIDLLKIAEQGGRIGIAKAEIGSFVQEMNKANVALGDSFEGGVEEVANKLGKLKFLFEETKDADIATAYNAIGSAINELGANGVASEANITEFTTRLGSLPAALKPSIKEALALGAAFEESGIEAEVSSRAYNIFMKQASTESAKFAKVMGISEQAVKNMINTNPLDFMMKFAEGMRGMDATDTAKTLDYLGVNADGANKVIGAMGNNIDRFNELIDISNDSFNDGSSLIEEYNVKNTNLAATLEKVGKTVNGWFSSQGFNNWLFGLVNGFAILIGATDNAEKSGQKWRNTLSFTAKVIAIVISAMVTSVGWQKLVALWTTRNTEATLLYTIASKARAFADGVVVVSTQLLAAVTMLLTGNIKGAAQAFRVMTATMMTTPWGFILGAIAAIGTAYVMFSDSAKEAASAQSLLVQHSKDVDTQLQKESSTFSSLIKVIQDETATTEARSVALEKAKQIGGEYTKGLTLENAATFEGKKMIDAYIGSLKRKIELQVYQTQIDKLIDEIAEKKNKKLEDEVNWLDAVWASAKNFGNAQMATSDIVITATLRRTKALEDLQNQLGFTQKQMEEYLKANPDVIKNINASGGEDFTPGDKTGSTTEKKNPNSSIEELNKLRLDSDSRYNDLLLKNRRQLEDDKIALMQDGYQKELAIENLRFEREIEDLQLQKVHAEEIAKLDEDIAKAKESKDITRYNALLEIKKGWGEKNKALDDQINKIIESKRSIHFYKLATIHEKEAEAELKRYAEQFEREKLARETAYLEQLALLGHNEYAKSKLKKKYEEEELAAQKAFLEKLVSENQKVLKGLNSKVDLSLLTPEQKQAFEDNVNELINKIAKLKSEIASLKGDKSNGTDFNILSGAGTDILGFSPEQWNQVFSNFDTVADKIKAVETVIGGLQNAFSMYSAFADANQQREIKNLDRTNALKKRKLKQDLDNGLINKVQYQKAIDKLDEEKEKKTAEFEYKKAKRDRVMSLFNIAVNTGVGIMKAVVASPLTGGMPWTAIIAGMGAIQAATVLATPLPAKGYEQGLYPIEREQDGKIFNAAYGGKTKSGLVRKPTYFLTGENGPEMIIDSRAYSQISPETKNALLRELRGIKGFENGYYNKENMRFETPAVSSPISQNSSDELLKMALVVIQDNTNVMREIKDSGLVAIVSSKDTNSMKELKKGLEAYTKLIEKIKK